MLQLNVLLDSIMINYDDYDYDVYQSNVHDLNQGLDSVI